MSETIKGFQTTLGIKKYDYNSLDNTPDLTIYLEETEVSSTAAANKILRLNENAALPANITGKAASVDWSGINEKPDSLEGFGLSNEVYTKNEVYSKDETYSKDEVYLKDETYSKDEVYLKEEVYTKEQINEIIKDVETSGAGFTQALIEHDSSENAHNYIRNLITNLSNRLNAIADSDDETLDQISELVAYIKDNRDLISQITTNKINKIDIINDLVSNITDKPLSAAQGAVLRAMIEAIVIPTKLSELQEDVNHRTVTDAEKAAWNEPDIEIDTALEQSGMAADAKAVGDALKQKQPTGDYALNSAIPTQLSQLQPDENHRTVTDAEKEQWNIPHVQIDTTLTISGKAADAKTVGSYLENKVDKIDGKSLSTNDYTTAEKEKLAGIDTGANKTVVDSSLSSTSINPVQNKIIHQALTTKQNIIQAVSKTLSSTNWSNNFQSINIDGIDADTKIICGPAPISNNEYGEAGVYCSSQSLNTLTFTCTKTPTTNLEINIILF